MFNRIFGLSPLPEFVTTYTISIISAALGLAKCLKSGVARPIAPGGALDGLLTVKFLIAFLASAMGLVTRAVCIGLTVGIWAPHNPLAQALTPVFLFLPPLLLSLFSTLNFLNVSSLKILYRHPSLIILPTVTYFTFGRHNTGCSSYCCSENNRVIFSKKFTWVNIAVSTVAYLVWGVWMFWKLQWEIVQMFLSYILIPIVPSILLTALFLHLDKLCCCNPREQLSVFDPDLEKRFFMVAGEVVEDTDDDIETPKGVVRTGACCSCFISISNLSNLLE